jgi:hypothetical protein
MLVSMRNDINKMTIYAELCYWPEPVKGVRCHTREGINALFGYR